MRVFISAAVIALVLPATAMISGPASADSAIGEMQSTEGPASSAPAAPAADATPDTRTPSTHARHRTAHHERGRSANQGG